jgi:hypothetical protein
MGIFLFFLFSIFFCFSLGDGCQILGCDVGGEAAVRVADGRTDGNRAAVAFAFDAFDAFGAFGALNDTDRDEAVGRPDGFGSFSRFFDAGCDADDGCEGRPTSTCANAWLHTSFASAKIGINAAAYEPCGLNDCGANG